MLKILFALASINAAHAECMGWGYDLHGDKVCIADDLVNRNPVVAETPSTRELTPLCATFYRGAEPSYWKPRPDGKCYIEDDPRNAR